MGLKSRLVKADCRDCGYTVRVTRKWLLAGMPDCGICHQPMRSLELEEYEAELRADEALPTPLRVQFVTLRKGRDCSSCGGFIRAGDESKRTVWRGAELEQWDECAACADPQRGYAGGTIGNESWRDELVRA